MASMIWFVAVRPLYLITVRVFGGLALLARGDATEAAELLALHCKVAAHHAPAGRDDR